MTAPIVGPRTLAQLEEMIAVADRHADQTLRVALEALNPPGTAAANFHNTSGWLMSKVDDD